MKRLLLILLLFPSFCWSQKIGDGVMNIYNSVGLITYTNPSGTLIEEGTGTLMYKQFKGGFMKIFLITCKHVLPSFDISTKIQFAIKNDSSKTNVTTLTITIFDSLKRYIPLVKFDPLGNDLAVIDITDIFLNFPLRNLQRLPIPYTLLATRDSLSEYNAPSSAGLPSCGSSLLI